ncbi:FadE17 protein (PROBABLE ACYL-COA DEHYDROGENASE FADE17) [Pseudonocardia sp. Ae168_Ps1]|uniref:acyl-CoA dehydrogenase family protein n=1 Tax=unclassified Pseudonocardia TaxID=2619320 RepID=UPI0006CB68CC|nr:MULTISPECIES: acyl-CoA dehydrogenase family protein [unclassified Pseudonocardia]ALE74850.1 acyl-CoA dehydrogenase [Pseudonocardia sp. EC080625-04]ALL74185.1 acyl-CoA dehydrogenase [Pseudonocardia sp. EC080610-09]ALL81209.1 acyl-CoA dehydrogenase [Pseudonocardia sp. EC080619-01]OLL75883.1 FadE17 protein (PROBABLE ACYL-COA DEHYDROGENASE FADE17) [Pseudonocardia sp. Ae150A_Ps1]OLL81881.1 FadE17 protein (PROBABLE ACYL-COA DEHYDROGENASE FADE17) [Pseudonocardia sp. Ae168_Ps1]
MDLTFTAAEEEFRSELRSWLSANIPQEWTRPGFWESLDDDESFRLRRDWERDKADAGFAGIQWPTEYGGRGGTPGMKAIYDEEMVRAHAPRTVNPLGLTFLAPTVMAIGTDAQKKEIIGPLLRNEVVWCQGFSEPGAGSDLAALSTKGVRDGDDFVVNGQKVWTTNAVHGDKIFTMVRTEAGSEKHRGISMLLIDMDQPGVTARPLRQMSGASEFGEVFFDDARVAAADCLGEIGDGWRTAMLLLSFERGASGISQYTEFRRQYDEIAAVARTLGRDTDPVVRDDLARVLTELECLKLHSMHVLTQVEQGRDLGFEASMTKLQWSEAFQDLWEVYDRILGEHATLDTLPDGTDLRPLHGQAMWSRSVTIWGGSSQVQRNITAERVLGLPR